MCSSVFSSSHPDLNSLCEDICFKIFSYCDLRDMGNLSQVNLHFYTRVNKAAKHFIKIMNAESRFVKMQPGRNFQCEAMSKVSKLSEVYRIYQLLINQKGTVFKYGANGPFVQLKEFPSDNPFNLKGFKDLYQVNRSYRRDTYMACLSLRESSSFNSCMESVQFDKERFVNEAHHHFDPSLLLLYAAFKNFWEVIPALVKAGARLTDQEKLEAEGSSYMNIEWIEAYESSVNREERFPRYIRGLSERLGEKVVNHCLKKAAGKRKNFTKKLMKYANPSLLLEVSAEANYKKPVSKLVQAGARVSVEGKGFEKRWVRAYEGACCEAESNELLI